jgi:4-amino-4-deoxy-L-arabinose transferase-like glycosyltransferase
MSSILKHFSKLNLLLAAILLLGLGLRLWGINFGLPYMYHPDEGVPVGIAMRMVRTGNLNPEFFNWPSLLIYLNALIYWCYFIIGRFLGWFPSPTDFVPPDVEMMAVGKASLPGVFMLGRGLAALVGAFSILVVYLIARLVTSNRLSAVLAALLISVDAVSVKNSHFIRPDILAIFFALISVLFALKIVEDPSRKKYILAGAGLGLATSSKYNLAFVVIPLLVAHLIRNRERFFWDKEIYIAGFVAVIVFILTTPFAVLDPSRFLSIGPTEDALIYSTGHPGAEGNSLQWYITFLWTTQSWTLVLASGAAILLFLRREWKGLVFLSFPLVYFVFISLYTVHFDTTILPVIPFIAVLAAWLVGIISDWLIRKYKIRRLFSSLVFALAAMVLAFPPLRASAAYDSRLLLPDGRERARQWIEANLPIGSRVALEAYSPYLDPQKFVVQGFYGLQEHSPDWYKANGYEYLVFSQEMFSRYFSDPTRYTTEVSRYEALFSHFTLLERFDDNGYEVRIYKTGAVLPPHRVAARFGNDGEVIELVGYDSASTKWIPGEPLNVKLYWRTLADKSEPLAVVLQLVDKSSRKIGSEQGDLFQGKGWQEGIFETDWKISTNANAMPGVYRLNVNVIQTQYSYSLPAKTWAGDDMGQVALGPFKMSVLPPSENELQSAQLSNVHFGDEIALLRYSVIGNARAGGSLPVRPYWQALAKPTHDYTVFVHLLDAEGKVVAQVDAPPRAGTYPTTIWDVGEIIRDDYSLKLPADLAPGPYRIELGLYDYPSLARLPVTDANGNVLGDHWVLPDSIQVVQ